MFRLGDYVIQLDNPNYQGYIEEIYTTKDGTVRAIVLRDVTDLESWFMSPLNELKEVKE